MRTEKGGGLRKNYSMDGGEMEKMIPDFFLSSVIIVRCKAYVPLPCSFPTRGTIRCQQRKPLARYPLTFPGGAAHDPNDRPSPPGAGHAAGRRSHCTARSAPAGRRALLASARHQTCPSSGAPHRYVTDSPAPMTLVLLLDRLFVRRQLDTMTPFIKSGLMLSYRP